MDSPVRAASSILRFTSSVTRASAGTLAPASRRTTSPGTRSRAAISRSSPSRSAVARGAAMRRSPSMARSARYSWTKPSTTANSMITAMTTASRVCPSKAESPTATRRIRMRTFLNCARTRLQGEVAAEAASSFGPCSARRRAASSPVSPLPVEASRSWTAATESVCHADTGSAGVGAGACGITSPPS